MGFNWQQAIGAIAPTVATVLEGPLAGLAVDSIGKALGLTAPTVDSVKQALTGTPLTGDQITQLKHAEMDLQARLKELDIQEEQVYVGDRESARNREVSVRDNINRNLAYLVVTGFVALVCGVIFGGLKVDTVLAGTLVGYLSAKAEQVLAYYFGSSSGSARKTELMAGANLGKGGDPS